MIHFNSNSPNYIAQSSQTAPYINCPHPLAAIGPIGANKRSVTQSRAIIGDARDKRMDSPHQSTALAIEENVIEKLTKSFVLCVLFFVPPHILLMVVVRAL